MSEVEKTLAERGARYGDFADHAALCQRLQDTLRSTPGWGRLTPDKKQALMAIANKQARILSGDPEYTDNWHDIAGYAKLAEDRCRDTQTADMFETAPSGGGCRFDVLYNEGDKVRMTDGSFHTVRKGTKYPPEQGALNAAQQAEAQRIFRESTVDTRSTAKKGYENGN